MALAALVIAATPGEAHDTDAPRGAAHTWLPSEQWVGRHWIPFDEQALKAELGLRGRELEAYLYNDHRTLAALARRRGITVDALADRLVARWRPHVDAARLGLLRERARRILTQGHLAQHMFFHVFHGISLRAAARSVFGVSPAPFWRLRKGGATPVEIARRGGVSRKALRSRVIRLLTRHREQGLRTGQSSPLESARILGRQLRLLGCWLRRPIAGSDPANPYGKAHHQHGHHRAGWPANALERRRSDRSVERVRRSLPKSCWRPPPAWAPAG